LINTSMKEKLVVPFGKSYSYMCSSYEVIYGTATINRVTVSCTWGYERMKLFHLRRYITLSYFVVLELAITALRDTFVLIYNKKGIMPEGYTKRYISRILTYFVPFLLCEGHLSSFSLPYGIYVKDEGLISIIMLSS
jgi:hypothetical protein